ncbi:MAG: hypothetical protein ACKOW2_06115 [Sphingobacteriaceae bacterium]
MVNNQEAISLATQIQQIDHLTEHFYLFKGFDAEHYFKADALQQLFFGDGHLVDASFVKPMEFTLASFSQAISKQIEEGNAQFFVQQEIADKTHIHGHIAQRLSVYEYTNTKDTQVKWKRGVNLIHYIYIDKRWLITAMIWQDESKDSPINESYLS